MIAGFCRREKCPRFSADIRVHGNQLVQALRLRIAKLQKLAFGKSFGKIEREIEAAGLALKTCYWAVAEGDEAPIDERQTSLATG